LGKRVKRVAIEIQGSVDLLYAKGSQNEKCLVGVTEVSRQAHRKVQSKAPGHVVWEVQTNKIEKNWSGPEPL